MPLQVPGTRSLRLFDAAAKRLNFSRAAQDVGVTPAAISHQIKELEDRLGFALFDRNSRSVRLTEPGIVFHQACIDALEVLRVGAVRAQKLSRGVTQLRVTLDAVFASKWMVPKLDRFRAAWPEVDLRFDIAFELRDFTHDDIDVAIRFGAGNYPGLISHRLFDNVIIPVCSPRLLSAPQPLAHPRDLLRHTLVHIEWEREGVSWPNWRIWMKAAGVDGFDGSNCVLFKESSHVIQAAIEGNVVALCDFSMVANDLSTGRLVRPFELGIKMSEEFAYHLVYPAELADDRRIAAFRDWVLDEVRTSPAAP
ncbi:MAG: transcriptional regulator GcvA [Rhizobiaceae bacterium]|nr:transcriptional regulator GcvA [Rhizobiaceae bacterium]